MIYIKLLEKYETYLEENRFTCIQDTEYRQLLTFLCKTFKQNHELRKQFIS